MKGNDTADALVPSSLPQSAVSTDRAQFNIEVAHLWQESPEQVAPMFERQIVRSSFGRMSRGNDQRSAQPRHLTFQLIRNYSQIIQAQLKEIRRMRHSAGQSQLRPRGNDAHNTAPGAARFDRFTRSHILVIP